MTKSHRILYFLLVKGVFTRLRRAAANYCNISLVITTDQAPTSLPSASEFQNPLKQRN